MSAAMPPLSIRRHGVTVTVLEVGENVQFHRSGFGYDSHSKCDMSLTD
jgi:hypothetical protein